MVPPFKFYFYPFLNNLDKRGCCRLSDVANYIAKDIKLSKQDQQEMTRGGGVTKHLSRVNYCASYLKKMGLVESLSLGAYNITSRGKQILEEFGNKLTLNDLRNLPEFIATQVNESNVDYVYIKPHMRGDKLISAYFSKKDNVKSKNPNIEMGIIDTYREKLKNIKDDQN